MHGPTPQLGLSEHHILCKKFLANHELLTGDLAEVKLTARNRIEKKMSVHILDARRAGIQDFEIAAEFVSEN